MPGDAMSTNEKTKRALTAAPRWPDVHRNYRRLAIPAVVAAVIADKGDRPLAGKRPAERRRRESR
jgi:hypothetical protein